MSNHTREPWVMHKAPNRRLSAHRWWPVGFTDELFAEGTMKPMVKCDGCLAATRSCYGCMGECQLEKREKAEKAADQALVDCGQCPRSCGCVGSCMKGWPSEPAEAKTAARVLRRKRQS